MLQNKTLELSFHLQTQTGATQGLTAEFINNESRITVNGFYDGDGTWKVRFLPQKTGVWRWKVSGILYAEGEFVCNQDPTAHGLVKTKGSHFVYQDNTCFLPVGTTIYAMLHQPDELVKQTLETLSEAPFNKVRLCLFPKHYDMVTNEPRYFPFEKNADGKWDVHRLNITFWQRLEWVLESLQTMNIQADLILFHPYDRWGFCGLSMEENRAYLDTVIARVAAFPNVWWSLANEYDLVTERSLEDWAQLEEYIAENDPYGHLLSCHNCMASYDHARPAISHVSLQSSLVGWAGKYRSHYQKPVIFDEMRYEGNVPFDWGNISAFELVHRFWSVYCQGCYASHGETYLDENNVIWWATGGKLKGESSQRIAFLKRVFETLPGPIDPMPQRGVANLATAPDSVIESVKDTMPMIYAMARSAKRMDRTELEMMDMLTSVATGHCGEDAFLYYYGRNCPAVAELQLSENATYRVEVMDIWQMTRRTICMNASGAIKVELPGKEGIAVIATRTKAENKS